MRGLMVCGEYPDIRVGRITSALRDNGIKHGVVTLRYPPQFDFAYDFIDWNHTDGSKKLIDRAMKHQCDVYHVHGELHNFWPVEALKERTDKPVILNVHDLASARPNTTLDVWEESGIAAADALVWVTEEQRVFAEALGFDVDKPYAIVPNYVSSRYFIDKKVLPHIGGVVVHGGTLKRGENPTSIDYSATSDALEGQLHVIPGGDSPDYGIVHPTEMDYGILMHRLSQFDWGFCGTPNPDAVWGMALPTKVGEYFAAGIPVIALNCPPVKKFCDMGMGIYLTDVRDVPKAAATDPKPYVKNVLKYRSQFTTERAIAPLVELYKALDVPFIPDHHFGM